MTDAVGIIGSSTGGISPPVSPAPALSGSNVSFAPPPLPASFENPRVIQDPTAGYITQYLSANGSQIISQTPSAITVAYLRDGLQADGTPKHLAVTA